MTSPAASPQDERACPECGDDGLVVVGWNEDAYENIEGRCPSCSGCARPAPQDDAARQDALGRLRERHERWEEAGLAICTVCDCAWPCDTIRAVEEAEQLREDVRRWKQAAQDTTAVSNELLGELMVERDALAEQGRRKDAVVEAAWAEQAQRDEHLREALGEKTDPAWHDSDGQAALRSALARLDGGSA